MANGEGGIGADGREKESRDELARAARIDRHRAAAKAVAVHREGQESFLAVACHLDALLAERIEKRCHGAHERAFIARECYRPARESGKRRHETHDRSRKAAVNLERRLVIDARRTGHERLHDERAITFAHIPAERLERLDHEV